MPAIDISMPSQSLALGTSPKNIQASNAIWMSIVLLMTALRVDEMVGMVESWVRGQDGVD